MRGNKKAAIEMSIGTIVTIVLSMSMLILGMVLIKNIFSGAQDVTEITNEQLMSEMSGMFGEDERLIINPDSNSIKIEVGENGGFAVGIKNRLTEAAETTFKYTIRAIEIGSNCPTSFTLSDAEAIIITGKSISDTTLTTGQDPIVRKVKMFVPEGTPLCSFTYEIKSTWGNSNTHYATDFMDVTILA
jgi:hypothetical protein